MDAMQEALADQREIEEVIKLGGEQATGADPVEEEIQEELLQMQREAEEEKRKQEDERRMQAAQADPPVARVATVAAEAEQLKEDLGDLSLGKKQALPAE